MSIPSSTPRHHIQVHLGATTGTPGMHFLYDGGATPSVISAETYQHAKNVGAVKEDHDSTLPLASADGSQMASHPGQQLQLTLADGYSFTAPFQVVPNLSTPGLIGRNVIKALGLTRDPKTDTIVRNVKEKVKGTPVKAVIMDVHTQKDSETTDNKTATQTETNVPLFSDLIWGPIVDPHEEPLNTPDKTFSFHPTEMAHISPYSATKVKLQAYTPEGLPFHGETEFICNVAPSGSCIATKTDVTGKCELYFENPTQVPQEMPPQFVAAIGTPLHQYFSHRGFLPSSKPKEAISAIRERVEKLTEPSTGPPSPETMAQINAQVKKAPRAIRSRLHKLLVKYHDVFAADKFDLGKIPNKEHSIQLTDNIPVYTKQFKIPEAHREFLIKNLKDWIAAGIVKKTSSRYNSPIFVVPKKDGSLRVVLDYRKLNAKTLPDRYSIKTLESCFAEVGRKRSKIFSTLDLTSAFWQLALEEASQDYSCFTMPGFGQFKWLVGAMGLTGCPASFARIMDEIMAHLENVITYIDDILVHSKDEDDHFKHLEEVLQRLSKHKLKLNLTKCEMFQKEVTYLGFTITGTGILPGRHKIDAIKKTPAPVTMKQLQAFLGLCNFLRGFIPEYQLKTGPMYDLTKKDTTWKEGSLPPKALDAFYTVQRELVAMPKLALPGPHAGLHLYVDAAQGDSHNPGGIGAVLFQERETDKALVPLGFASRRLRGSEKNYPIFSLELQAAVFGIDTFDHLLIGRNFDVYTDHKPLTTMTKIETKTLNRLQELLGRHACQINYVEGKKNIVADYLSRFSHLGESDPIAAIRAISTNLMPLQKEAAYIASKAILASLRAMCADEEIAVEQSKCPQAGKLIKALTKGEDVRFPMNRTFNFTMHEGLLHAQRKNEDRLLVFVPQALRRKYMLLAHKSVGHSGYEKTMARMAPFVFWPDMHADLRLFLPTCGPCAIKATRKQEGGKTLQSSLHQEERPNMRVHLDLFGPLCVEESQVDKKTGKTTILTTKEYVLVATDAFSKLVRLVTLPDKEAITVAKAFQSQWCHLFGYPKAIVTDQGSEFTNSLLKEILDSTKVRHYTTAPYHPAANGQAEVFNRSMAAFLRATLHEEQLKATSWKELISLLQFTYNTNLHRAIKKSPFQVLFGYDPRTPGFEGGGAFLEAFDKIMTPTQRWESAHEANTQSRKAQLKYANKGATLPVFQEGDRVLLIEDAPDQKKFPNPKLAPKWKKATIKQLGSGEHNYFVSLQSGRKRTLLVHVSKLRLDTTPAEESSDPTFKAHPTHQTMQTERRITRSQAKIAAIKGFTSPPPGIAWTRLNMVRMFAAYAANKLCRPEIETGVWGPMRPVAVIPRAQNAHEAIAAEPLGYDQAHNDANQEQEDQETEFSIRNADYYDQRDGLDISRIDEALIRLFRRQSPFQDNTATEEDDPAPKTPTQTPTTSRRQNLPSANAPSRGTTFMDRLKEQIEENETSPSPARRPRHTPKKPILATPHLKPLREEQESFYTPRASPGNPTLYPRLDGLQEEMEATLVSNPGQSPQAATKPLQRPITDSFPVVKRTPARKVPRNEEEEEEYSPMPSPIQNQQEQNNITSPNQEHAELISWQQTGPGQLYLQHQSRPYVSLPIPLADKPDATLSQLQRAADTAIQYFIDYPKASRMFNQVMAKATHPQTRESTAKNALRSYIKAGVDEANTDRKRRRREQMQVLYDKATIEAHVINNQRRQQTSTPGHSQETGPAKGRGRGRGRGRPRPSV